MGFDYALILSKMWSIWDFDINIDLIPSRDLEFNVWADGQSDNKVIQ